MLIELNLIYNDRKKFIILNKQSFQAKFYTKSERLDLVGMTNLMQVNCIVS